MDAAIAGQGYRSSDALCQRGCCAAERSESAARTASACTPLSDRNRSFLFNRGLYIVQVLQEGLFHHSLEKQLHGDRHQTCNDALRLGIMRTRQRHAAVTALGNARGG